MTLSKNKITKTATQVFLIQLFSYTVVSKQKMKMETQDTTAPSYHSKVTSSQNTGVPFFSYLAHGVYYYISMFGLSQRYPDTFSLPVLVDVQRLHENGK